VRRNSFPVDTPQIWKSISVYIIEEDHIYICLAIRSYAGTRVSVMSCKRANKGIKNHNVKWNQTSGGCNFHKSNMFFSMDNHAAGDES